MECIHAVVMLGSLMLWLSGAVGVKALGGGWAVVIYLVGSVLYAVWCKLFGRCFDE